MKTNSFLLAVGLLFGLITNVISQQSNPSIAVLDIDITNQELTPDQLASLARIEITKLGTFEVIDPYDIEYLFKKNDFDANGCYGKICLIEAGKILGVDKVLSGSVETFEKHVVITLRQVDVKAGKIEKANAMEFLKIDQQLFQMLEITVQKLYDIEVNENLFAKLTNENDFESTINIPEADILNLSGPRMGMTLLTGEAARVQTLPKDQGGYDALPFMSQFGYQFEYKYLNSGNVQALFEFIPMVSGLDQGRIIPSITVLSGIRSNKTGIEFGFGPNIFLYQLATGYFDTNNNFILSLSDFDPEVNKLQKRLDSRGKITIGSGIVLAAGKTFRSGKLNIPVNAFFIPGKGSQRFGISFGFNINKTKSTIN